MFQSDRNCCHGSRYQALCGRGHSNDESKTEADHLRAQGPALANHSAYGLSLDARIFFRLRPLTSDSMLRACNFVGQFCQILQPMHRSLLIYSRNSKDNTLIGSCGLRYMNFLKSGRRHLHYSFETGCTSNSENECSR